MSKSPPLTAVATRLGPDEMALVDEVLARMRAYSPFKQPTRADALRWLVSRSGSALNDLPPAPASTGETPPLIFKP